MYLPNAPTTKSFPKTGSHITIILSISLFLVIGFAVYPGKPGSPVNSEAHVGPNSPPNAVNDGTHTVHDHMVLQITQNVSV
jgi:hypothetical protein